MNYLLDTHYLIWLLSEPNKMKPRIRKIIEDQDNTIIFSVISLWEISLKFSLGKLQFDHKKIEDIPSACTEMGIELAPLYPKESSSVHLLAANFHKDPFDRMLICQAMNNRYTLITNDEQILQYKSVGLKVLSG